MFKKRLGKFYLKQERTKGSPSPETKQGYWKTRQCEKGRICMMDMAKKHRK